MAEREKLWAVEYYHQGAWWGTEVHASSIEEASEKVVAMGRGKVLGETALKIKVPNWLGRLLRLLGIGATGQ